MSGNGERWDMIKRQKAIGNPNIDPGKPHNFFKFLERQKLLTVF